MRFGPGRGLFDRGLFAASIVAAAIAAPAAAQPVGVASAVIPEATGAPPSQPVRVLVLGQDIVRDERVVTGPTGQTQILFRDEAAITLGPNSELTVDDFAYDPGTGRGRLAMSAAQGVLRFVGGRLSKASGAVALRTPAGVIGVRGGIFVAKVSRGGLEVVFLYGEGLSVTNNNVTQTITRPGLAITVAGIGAPPSPPGPPAGGALGNLLGQLSGRSGATGGSGNPPTDAKIVSSRISAAGSDNVPASVRQSAAPAPPSGPAPPTLSPGNLQSRAQLNSVSKQPAIVQVQPTAANPGLPRP